MKTRWRQDVGSCINPFIYALWTKRFKKACYRLWCNMTYHATEHRLNLKVQNVMEVGITIKQKLKPVDAKQKLTEIAGK